MALEKARTLDLREACVREALAIIGKDGLDALSLRDVARRLGVSHQAPYKHFPSREHILAEVVGRAYASFAKHIDQRSRSADPYEDLGHLGSCYLNYAKKHPLQYQLMFGMPLPDPEDHPEMLHHARHAFTVLRETIARLPDRRSPAEIELDALYAWSVVHGLASILETRAGDQHGFGTDVMRQASGHVLRRIGEALGSPKRKK